MPARVGKDSGRIWIRQGRGQPRKRSLCDARLGPRGCTPKPTGKRYRPPGPGLRGGTQLRTRPSARRPRPLCWSRETASAAAQPGPRSSACAHSLHLPPQFSSWQEPAVAEEAEERRCPRTRCGSAPRPPSRSREGAGAWVASLEPRPETCRAPPSSLSLQWGRSLDHWVIVTG
jgi:hypothetical protein